MDKNQILEKVGWRIKVEPYLQYGISPHGIILRNCFEFII